MKRIVLILALCGWLAPVLWADEPSPGTQTPAGTGAEQRISSTKDASVEKYGGMTDQELEKLRTGIQAPEGLEEGMPLLPARTHVPQASGKRARPIEVEPGVSTDLGKGKPYPGLTAQELQKLELPHPVSSNTDGRDSDSFEEPIPAPAAPPGGDE